MIAFITLLYSLFVFNDIVPLVKNKKRNTLIVYSVILVVSYILFVLTILRVFESGFTTWFIRLIDMVFGKPKESKLP